MSGAGFDSPVPPELAKVLDPSLGLVWALIGSKDWSQLKSRTGIDQKSATSQSLPLFIELGAPEMEVVALKSALQKLSLDVPDSYFKELQVNRQLTHLTARIALMPGDPSQIIDSEGESAVRIAPPSVPFGHEWEPSSGTRRERLAAWVTHPDNKRFERAIANRVWANFFGAGLIEPVDDLRITNPASNEKLLTAVANYLADQKFLVVRHSFGSPRRRSAGYSAFAIVSPLAFDTRSRFPSASARTPTRVPRCRRSS